MPRKAKSSNNPFFSSAPKRGHKKTRDPKDTFLNTAIALLSLVLVAFIISFSGRHTRGGLQIETASLNETREPLLATQYYDLNPILDIEVEILNGCGESGLAAKFSDFLRSQQIDVVRSENADHFNYATTLIIQRNEKVDNLRAVAAALNFDLTDKARVMVIPDLDRDVDVTLILGKDYSTIAPVADFLESRY
ncbi:MAG: LytR C-terminal domain-containing protein [Candidatus Neomarinimicrobiota bacterium]